MSLRFIHDFSLIALACSSLAITSPALAQVADQSVTPSSTIDGDFNNVFQTPNQNNAQNSNINEFNVPNIYPLDHPIHTPVNTENDFGFNLSAGVNTLDASNLTFYLGIIYHPGRSDAHEQRMSRLNKETEVLEIQRQIAEAQLQRLRQEISKAERQLQELE